MFSGQRLQRLMFGCLGLACGMAAVPALAGPQGLTNGVSFHPSDPDLIVSSWEFDRGGLFYSTDGGASWRFTCTYAIIEDYGDRGNVPKVLMASDGALLFTTRATSGEHHTRRSPAGACGWSTVSDLEGLQVQSMLRDPSTPGTIYADTYDATNSMAQLHRSTDDGQSWTVLDSRMGSPKGIAVSALADETRIYWGVFSEDTFSVRVSDDSGVSFESRALPAGNDGFTVVGADPGDPDRVFALARRAAEAQDTVMMNDNAATTDDWRDVGSVTTFGGLVVADDGTAYFGDEGVMGAGKVLWKLDSGSTSASMLSEDYRVRCLGINPHDDTLWACDSFWLRTIDRQSGALATTELDMTELSDFVSCPDDASSPCALCAEFQLQPGTERDGYCHPVHYGSTCVCQRAQACFDGMPPDSVTCADDGGAGSGGSGGTAGGTDGGTDDSDGASSGGAGGSGGGVADRDDVVAGVAEDTTDSAGGEPSGGGDAAGSSDADDNDGGGCRILGANDRSSLGFVALAVAWLWNRRPRPRRRAPTRHERT